MRGVCTAVLLCGFLAPVAADEVVLTNGRRLSCEVLEVGEAEVTVRLPHGTLVFPRSRVERIIREDSGDYLRREARARLVGGSTEGAVEMYERALRHRPGDASARRGLAEALVRHTRALASQYRFKEAFGALGRLEEVEPGHPAASELAAWMAREAAVANALVGRANAAAAEGNFRRALDILDAWRRRRPVDDEQARATLAAAHLGAARQALDAGDLRGALDHYRAAQGYGEQRRTREPLYLLRPIAVLEALKVGNAEEARRLLDGIATTYPDPAVPVFLRAVRHHVLGEVDDAVKAYAESARLAERGAPGRGLAYELVRQYAASTLRAAIARPPEEGVTRWREVFLGSLVRDDSAEHFTVYAATGRTAASVAAAADEAYGAIARDLLGRLPGGAKAEIVVHPSRGAYNSADPAPPGTPLAGVTIGRQQTGGICYATVDEKGAPLIRVETYESVYLLPNTLPHEIVHVVQRRGLKAYRRSHWLDEGLAMLYESAAARANRAALWRQLKRDAIPLPEFLALKSTPPDRISLYYHQAHALTEFLRGLGDERQWTRFLDAYGAGTLASALRQAYEIQSTAELERLWVEHIG